MRRPQYVTSAVQSIVFTQTLSGNVTLSSPTVTTMTIGGPNCTSSAGAQTCSVALPGPLGQDQWNVDTYASTDGTGAPLSIGVLPFTIVAGAANATNLTLNPVVDSIAFVPASASCNASSACTSAVLLEALDATGSIIVGATPFVSTTGSALTVSLSAATSLTMQTSAGAAAATSMTNASAINLSKVVYDGTASGIATLTATAGSLSASFALTLLTHLYVANAGSGNMNSYLNGAMSTPTISGLSAPGGVAVDSAGNIYVANTYAGTIQIYTSTGAASTIAGGVISGLFAFGWPPEAVAVDSAGNIYVANPGANTVKIYNSNGVLNTAIAGGTISSGLDSPWGVAVDSVGNIYIANYNTSNVKIFTSTGAASTIAGGTITTGLNGPTGVAVDHAGNIYVANKNANNVKIYTNSTTAGGVASTIAGGTISGLSNPWSVAIDSIGNIYVANSSANNVKIYTSTGAISTIAGGTISALSSPFGVAVY